MKFIGDVHGKYGPYKKIIKNCQHSIQVGDMGVGFKNWHGEFRANPPYDKMVDGDHRFIRGNHDNPSVCRNHTQCIKDGTQWTTDLGNKVMFIGGAWSIDHALRTNGLDWWNDEELSMMELSLLIDEYEKFKPDFMITHDAPQSVVKKIFLDGTHKPLYHSKTGSALDAMWEIHQPKIWVAGHWHTRADQVINGCRFIFLEELGTIDLDI
jgi:hypothetical protein